MPSFPLQAVERINLSTENIIPDEYKEITLDNNITSYPLIKENGILYVDSRFFADYFGTDEATSELVKSSVSHIGIVTYASDEKAIFLPLMDVIKGMGLRYTYSPLYGKEIVRIRTGNEFAVNPDYTYNPSYHSYNKGNIPQTAYTYNPSTKYYSGNYSYTRGSSYSLHTHLSTCTSPSSYYRGRTSYSTSVPIPYYNPISFRPMVNVRVSPSSTYSGGSRYHY